MIHGNHKIVEKIKNDITRGADFGEMSRFRPSWHEYFMTLAKIAATRSTCISRPNGAVIVKDKQVIATGYNGSVPGNAHCSDDLICYKRSVGKASIGKYDFCRSIHAEANAVVQASKKGITIEGSEIYMTLFPCYMCSKMLISAGIKHIYYEYEYESENKDRDSLWLDALRQAKVEVTQVTLSDETIVKNIFFLSHVTASRRELSPDGKMTGNIENVNSEKIFKKVKDK